MTCRHCIHFLTSEKAAQRAVLDGYGYCKVAPTIDLRARFFADSHDCWLSPIRFQEKK